MTGSKHEGKNIVLLINELKKSFKKDLSIFSLFEKLKFQT